MFPVNPGCFPCPPVPCVGGQDMFPVNPGCKPCPPVPCVGGQDMFPVNPGCHPCPPVPCVGGQDMFPVNPGCKPCPPVPCVGGQDMFPVNPGCKPCPPVPCVGGQDIFPVNPGCYTMYYGTTYAVAEEIIKTGFRQSLDGILGRGVYVTRDLNKAMKYPDCYVPRKVVLKLRVNIGSVIKITHPNHPLQKTWQDHGYDTAWCPPNTMSPCGQEEDCVFDPRRIKVVDIVHGNPDDVEELKLLLHHY